ncbi:uncharacterized protein A4U43_C07F39640 [Asparagus officinalis]|uniref:Uncharacterized protein n=1 Tax=Asparagus officinalis TaxID=4686 RepID=A0A5P1EIB3_ASPOF|nr:uncharacterized protein LOC109850354 [Asparagus officinalis]ONK65685.1 uncharacterized protein A4U43_C07F39640 [Asparagus officinalis]
MAAFNEIQKRKRAAIQQEKRAIHGDPRTGKLKQRAPPVSISGKRKRKLLKKLKREQKEAIEKGLVTMQDVEMAVADGSAQDNNQKAHIKFNVKGTSRLRIKKLKGKGKSKKKSANKPKGAASVDAMVE